MKMTKWWTNTVCDKIIYIYGVTIWSRDGIFFSCSEKKIDWFNCWFIYLIVASDSDELNMEAKIKENEQSQVNKDEGI